MQILCKFTLLEHPFDIDSFNFGPLIGHATKQQHLAGFRFVRKAGGDGYGLRYGGVAGVIVLAGTAYFSANNEIWLFKLRQCDVDVWVAQDAAVGSAHCSD